MEFAAKVDTWFLLSFYGGALFMFAGALLRRGVPGFMKVLLLVLAILFVCVGVFVDNRAYIVAGTELHEKDLFGSRPFRDLNRVTSVRPSNNPRASKAASLDRLRVEGDDGSVVFIAVEDKPAFLKALAENSRLVPDGDGLVRGP
ncbi:MAG: PH domain-containing protein [Myxococcales bacterium]|nr:PH domain-containing protein [Myxococcales bacterium]MDH3483211.1 PH domain-containing protein [Myxococcales bacterium]